MAFDLLRHGQIRSPAWNNSQPVALEGIELFADIAVPERARGLVLFAHGSGSSRHSPRNAQVTGTLNRGDIGTILIDLLTEEEEKEDLPTAALRFDIPLPGSRLTGITDWIARQPGLRNPDLGYFAASTGAAAALVAAAERSQVVRAVASRGGRPDLAGPSLRAVRAPTLFIVGGDDLLVLALNSSAMAQLPSETECKLEVIAGAGHLFEELGALGKVAALAGTGSASTSGSALVNFLTDEAGEEAFPAGSPIADTQVA